MMLHLKTKTSAAILAALLLTGCAATAPPASESTPASYGTFGNAERVSQANGWCELTYLDTTSLQACYDAAYLHCVTFDGLYKIDGCKEGE